MRVTVMIVVVFFVGMVVFVVMPFVAVSVIVMMRFMRVAVSGTPPSEVTDQKPCPQTDD